MKPATFLLVALLWAGVLVHSAEAQKMARQEFPANHAPIDVIRPALQKVLSPAGRFVILPGNGNVLVIDFPENVTAAGKVMANLKIPAPQVAMQIGVKTNVAPGAMGKGQPVSSLGGFPYPTSYDPPRIIANGAGGFIVIPAHPTGFRKRDVGFKMDTTPTINPDGSINVDINVEHTEFEGFINYGSPIFTSGIPRSVPVVANVGNPGFFRALRPGREHQDAGFQYDPDFDVDPGTPDGESGPGPGRHDPAVEYPQRRRAGGPSHHRQSFAVQDLDGPAQRPHRQGAGIFRRAGGVQSPIPRSERR